MAQISHLEQFQQSQEAARCFDDDLDFCPSLTAKELSEIILASILTQKELQAKQQQHQQQHHLHSPPRSPPHTSRAITIVDPTSRNPLYIPPSSSSASASASIKANKTMVGSGRYTATISTPTTAGLMTTSSNDYFNIMPNNTASRQQQQQQQQQMLFNNMYGVHAYPFSPMEQHQHNQFSMGMLSPSLSMGSYSPPRPASRIPIVNPDNGRVVSVPEGPSSGSSWQQQHFVAVR